MARILLNAPRGDRPYDHLPGSGAAFTADGDLDVQGSQEGLRATQRPASARGFLGQLVRSVEPPSRLQSPPSRSGGAPRPRRRARP